MSVYVKDKFNSGAALPASLPPASQQEVPEVPGGAPCGGSRGSRWCSQKLAQKFPAAPNVSSVSQIQLMDQIKKRAAGERRQISILPGDSSIFKTSLKTSLKNFFQKFLSKLLSCLLRLFFIEPFCILPDHGLQVSILMDIMLMNILQMETYDFLQEGLADHIRSRQDRKKFPVVHFSKWFHRVY